MRERLVPEELQSFASALQGFRLPSEINSLMIQVATKRGLPVTWTLRDIQNRYPMLGGQGNFWQTECLLEKLSADGLPYDKDVCEESGTVRNLVWLQHEGDMEVVLSACSCVIFDNTFNTNSLGFKFGVFSTVDRFGCTRLVACSLMWSECRESFKWVLITFSKLLGNQPLVILTDGDLWLADGIATTWHGTAHLLCTWHLSKCLLRNVKPCFGTYRGPLGQATQWTTFLRMWWRICWKGDTSCTDTFDEEWLALKQYFVDQVGDSTSWSVKKALRYLGGPPLTGQEVEADCEGGVNGLDPVPGEGVASASGDVLQDLQEQEAAELRAQAEDQREQQYGPPLEGDAVDGVDGVAAAGAGVAAAAAGASVAAAASGETWKHGQSLYDLRRKWAARFTSVHFTHGASSTQRGESIFASVKGFVAGVYGLHHTHTTPRHATPRHITPRHATPH